MSTARSSGGRCWSVTSGSRVAGVNQMSRVKRPVRTRVLAACIVAASVGAWVNAQTPAMPAVYAVSYVEVLPSSSPAAKTALREYRGASRADEGFVGLELFEKPDRAGHFSIIETWRDQKAFDAHAAAAHTMRLITA